MTILEQTYQKERPRLLNWLTRRLRLGEEPEDVLQDIFAKASAATLPIDNLVAWLYASARNAVIDIWRKREQEGLLLGEEDWDASPERLLNEYIFRRPASEAWRNELIEVLNEAIDRLPAEQKEVFLLQALDGYSFREIAELLDISINSAMSRKRYAVAKLREWLQDYYNII